MTIAERAKKLRAKSEILEDRAILPSDEVVKYFGKTGFTVLAVDKMNTTDRKTGENRHYYVIAVKEDKTVAVASGQVLTDLLDNLIEDFGGIEEFNDALAKEDFTLLPEFKRSKNGNRYLDFTVID